MENPDYEEEQQVPTQKKKITSKTAQLKIKHVEPECLYTSMTEEQFTTAINSLFTTSHFKSTVKKRDFLNALLTRTTSRSQTIDTLKTLFHLWNTRTPKPTFNQLLDELLPTTSSSTFYAHCFDQYIEEEKRQVINMQQPIQGTESMYTCKRCNSSNTYSYSVQLRRSDEPPTIFITCLNQNCGAKWKE